MKKLILGSLLAVTGLFMTSCLGEGSNQESYVSYGVVGTSDKTFKTIINSSVRGPVYSPEIAASPSISIGDCCQFAYTLDYDIPENSSTTVAANGYYTVTVSQYIDIPKYEAVPVLSDTTTFPENELAINSINLNETALFDNRLFLQTVHADFKTEQKQRFEFSYNREQETESEGGENVYNLYLRVYRTTEGSSAILNPVAMVNAFNMRDFFTYATQKETSAGNKSFKMKFNFINSFNEDKTVATWKATDAVSYIIPTDED